jgi:hypothetical protein
MHTTASFARIAGVALLATLLSGCMVHSKMPLIATSEMPEGFAGSYQVMGATDARSMRKLPTAARAACLDLGYSGQKFEAGKGWQGKRFRVFYCGYDPDKKEPLPVTRILREQSGFTLIDKDGKPAQLHLRTIHPELYLSQLEGEGTPENPRFDYLLMRTRAGDVEIVPLFCEDFPNAPSQPMPFTTPASSIPASSDPAADAAAQKAWEEKTPAGGAKDCEITTLESIQPDLDVLVGKVDAGTVVPLILLHRVAE